MGSVLLIVSAVIPVYGFLVNHGTINKRRLNAQVTVA